MRLTAAMQLVISLISMCWFTGMCIGCVHTGKDQPDDKRAAARITPEMLIGLGFKEFKDEPGTFEVKDIRLDRVMRELGFKLANLRPTAGKEPGTDVRVGDVKGAAIVVRAVRHTEQGTVSGGSLDPADATCAVVVSLNPAKTFKEPIAELHLRVVAVTIRGDVSKGVDVRLELSSVGTTELVVLRSSFWLSLEKMNAKGDESWTCQLDPSATAGIIKMVPGKATVVNCAASGDLKRFQRRIAFRDISKGAYLVKVYVADDPRMERKFDFQFKGTVECDAGRIQIK